MICTFFAEIEEIRAAEAQVAEDCKDPAQLSVGNNVVVERHQIGEEKYIIQESVEEIDEVAEKANVRELDRKKLRNIENTSHVLKQPYSQ